MSEDMSLDGYGASPAVVAAEMTVVGSAIESKEALEEAADRLAATDFWSIAGIVYAAALDLLSAGKHVAPASVLNEIVHRGDLDRIGGGAYLAGLGRHVVPTVALGQYIEIIAKDAQRRRIFEACSTGRQLASRPGWDGDADTDHVRKLLDEASRDTRREQVPDVASDVAALLDDLENPPSDLAGVTPAYADLAHLLTAYQPGQIIVVAARPAVGKSVFAVDAIRKAAIRDGKLSALFTLEMTRRDVLNRMLAAETGVNLTALRSRAVGEHDLERIVDAGARISGAPMVIDDRPGCSLETIRTTLRTMSRQGDIGLVVIDYLQLMTPPKAPSREQEVAVTSRGLKLLAMEFGVPIMLLSQLNRESEKRADKRPAVSDLRESGAIENDADMIILLHRDDAYEVESPRAGEVDLIVGKNRNGPTGTVIAAHQLHYSRFVDMAWSPTKGL